MTARRILLCEVNSPENLNVRVGAVFDEDRFSGRSSAVDQPQRDGGGGGAVYGVQKAPFLRAQPRSGQKSEHTMPAPKQSTHPEHVLRVRQAPCTLYTSFIYSHDGTRRVR